MDLHNLSTLEDYTKLSKYFISLYFPKLLYDDEAIGRVVYVLYKAHHNLNKTKSTKRFAYIKRTVIHEIMKYLEDKPKYIYKECYIKTPIDNILNKEFAHSINKFIDSLEQPQQQCIRLLYEGVPQIEIAKILGCSRQNISQLVIKTRKDWEFYVQKEEKNRKK